MTTRDRAALINSPAMLQLHALTIPVVIIDLRDAYGRTDVLVAPVGGSGEQWVRMANVQVLRRAS